ncbi:recombinase family protein [Kocuria sp. LHG3120]|uniref:recombinase family protein n=1 Tax=Kocuria sp. LHG3120 TaxID=2804590 RepID=UPI003CEEAD45
MEDNAVYAWLMQRAIIYARISQDRTGAGLGIDRQFTECEEYAAAHGLQVVGRLADNDISAYSGKPRPSYQELLERIRKGECEVVLTWHTDRLHRVPSELEEYIIASEQHGVGTQTVRAGMLDLATPAGRFMARQLGAIARYESEQKGERVSAKRRQAALAGQWQGGPRPFGWSIIKETNEHGRVHHNITINEKEAELVRWAFQAVLEGKPISGIVAHFQRSGVPSTRGNGWRHSTIRTLLQRTRNCGIESLKGAELGKSQFPPLVDEGTFRAVQRILKDPKRKTQDDNRVKHLLSGIARCHCGEPLVSSKASAGAPQYSCISYRFPATRRKDVRHVSRRTEELDAHVEERWPYIVYGPGSALRVHAPARAEDRRRTEEELTKLRSQQDDLIDMWANGVLERKQFERKNVELRGQVGKLEQELADMTEQSQLLPDLHTSQIAAYWQTLDVLEKRKLLRQSVDITCYSTDGRRFQNLEEPWKYVDIKPLPIAEGKQRIIYVKPTIEPIYEEWEPESAGLPAGTPAPWPPRRLEAIGEEPS